MRAPALNTELRGGKAEYDKRDLRNAQIPFSLLGTLQ
jgi:hypothetical protein